MTGEMQLITGSGNWSPASLYCYLRITQGNPDGISVLLLVQILTLDLDVYLTNALASSAFTTFASKLFLILLLCTGTNLFLIRGR